MDPIQKRLVDEQNRKQREQDKGYGSYIVGVYLLVGVVVVAILGMIFYLSSISQQGNVKTDVVPDPIKVALEQKDAKYCSQYIDERDIKGCTLEVNLLNRITIDEKKEIWTSMRTLDFSKCGDMRAEAQPICYDAKTLMEEINKVPECENLKTGYMKEYCKGTLLYFEAAEQKDASICKDMILPFSYRQKCVQGEAS